MATSGQAPTSGEYIVHHLTHLQNKTQTEVVDFSVINMDSVFWSITLGVLACAFMYFAARRATSGAPGRLQGLVEMIYEMVDSQAKGIVHNAKSREFVVPLAMVIFIWIFLMNFMDMLPVDFIPAIWHVAGPAIGAKEEVDGTIVDPARLVAAADRAMYEAKKLGTPVFHSGEIE